VNAWHATEAANESLDYLGERGEQDLKDGYQAICPACTAKVAPVVVGGVPLTLPAIAAEPKAPETKQQRDARMAWWRDARFGMFIHWGVYAVPAGQWQGKFVPPGGGEWIMHTANIPILALCEKEELENLVAIEFMVDDVLWKPLKAQVTRHRLQYLLELARRTIES